MTEEKMETILVVSAGYFGFGKSVKEARRNCVKAGGKGKMIGYVGTANLSINDFGEVTAKKAIKLGEI